jgi:hypothetical protein
MKQITVFVFMIVMITCFAASCKKPVRNVQTTEHHSSLIITWEFKSTEKDSEPYTAATLIINGSALYQHHIGEYYGKVRRILKPDEIHKEMIGGTISGFITNNQGRGHEVIVRYNETLQKLIIAEREWSDRLPPRPFSVIKTIPVPELRKERTGF